LTLVAIWHSPIGGASNHQFRKGPNISSGQKSQAQSQSSRKGWTKAAHPFSLLDQKHYFSASLAFSHRSSTAICTLVETSAQFCDADFYAVGFRFLDHVVLRRK
jgi:hypothetical protein